MQKSQFIHYKEDLYRFLNLIYMWVAEGHVCLLICTAFADVKILFNLGLKVFNFIFYWILALGSNRQTMGLA